MKLTRVKFTIALPIVCLGLLPALTVLDAQDFTPPKSKKISAEKQKQIAVKIRTLGAAIASLKKQGLGDPILADLEVYYQAAVKIVEHNEFFQPAFADWTLETLDRGLLRARLAASGSFPWLQQRGHAVVHGYRSRVDGSVQPYSVVLPKNYGKDVKKKWRVDIVLHGRDKTLTEVKFLHRHNGDKPAENEEFVQIDVYGRGNNAYRWAGERDVFEAIEAFFTGERRLGRGNLIGLERVVLRGFSMGGAGAWHIGLHMPDNWRVIGPGAGFTTTHGYVKNLPEKLPPHQEACLRIYDAVRYAENAFNVPVVAYAGSKDRQLQAAKNIQEQLKALPFAGRMKLLIAPGLAHKFPAEWRKKAEKEYAAILQKPRETYPKRVRFVTCTMKYPSCNWVEIRGLEKHYEKSLVDATWTGAAFKIKTVNIESLHLSLPEFPPPEITVTIDGQKLAARPWTADNSTHHLYLLKQSTGWKVVLPQFLLTRQRRQQRKSSGLQGPIDDAFTHSFLCVRGAGKPWNDAVQIYADASLERFRKEWRKYLRGDLPVKDDADVTNQDIAGKNLILFGDPASNTLIRQVIDGLPIRWTNEKITLGGKTVGAANHVPVLIYPSPLNSGRYVVLNSGHTFHESDFRGTNALLFPRLGDFALLRLKGGDNALDAQVHTAGLFDEYWRFAPKASTPAAP